jgi:hypothetical protein
MKDALHGRETWRGPGNRDRGRWVAGSRDPELGRQLRGLQD